MKLSEKLNIFFLLLLIVSINLDINAQRSHNIKWSNEIEERGRYEVIGEYGGFLYLKRYLSLNESKIDEFEIQKVDKNFNLISSVTIEEITSGKYVDVGTIMTPEGVLHLYYQTTKKGDVYYSGQLFEYEKLTQGDVLGLAKFKNVKSSRKTISIFSAFQNSLPLGYILSEDKSKVLLYYNQDRVGKNNETYFQYKVIDITEGFNTVQEGEFYSDHESKRMVIKDIVLANNGYINYLFKVYKERGRREFVDKKPNYNYEIHHITGDSYEYIYDIKTRDIFYDDLKLGCDTNGNVYAAGFEREKPEGKIIGSFFLSLDVDGNARARKSAFYKPRDVEMIDGKPKDKVSSNFQILDVKVDDGIIYTFNQSIERRNLAVNNFNQPGQIGGRITWYLDDYLIEAWDSQSGERKWIANNPRNQEARNEFINEYVISDPIIYNGEIYMIYNERAINHERLSEKKNLKTSSLPGDYTQPTIIKIDKTGNARYRVLEDNERKFYIPRYGVSLTGEGLFLVNVRSNNRAYFIGYVDTDKLDF